MAYLWQTFSPSLQRWKQVMQERRMLAVLFAALVICVLALGIAFTRSQLPAQSPGAVSKEKSKEKAKASAEPATNVYTDASDYVVQLVMPGAQPEQILVETVIDLVHSQLKLHVASPTAGKRGAPNQILIEEQPEQPEYERWINLPILLHRTAPSVTYKAGIATVRFRLPEPKRWPVVTRP